MTEKKTGGGIRGEAHKERIGATNHARFLEKFDHELLAKMQSIRAEGAELSEIAEATGKSMSTVSRWLRNGCERRQNATQGKSRERGKPYLKSHGYVCLTVNGRAVYQHTHVAEKSLGRSLRSGEVVHHINRNRSDNRPENLLVCSDKYHRELHARMSKHPYWNQLSPLSQEIETP